MKKIYTMMLLCFAAMSMNAADYYVAGSIPGIEWGQNRGEMVQSGDNYTYNWAATASGKFEFKITACASGWDCDNWGQGGKGSSTNFVFSCAEGDNVVITFKPADESVTVSGNTDAPVGETKYYVAGTIPGCEWNPSSQEMTQDANDKNLYKYSFTAEAASYEFKITDGTWATQFNSDNIDATSAIQLTASDGQNIKVTFGAAGEAAIIFNAATQKVSATGPQGGTPVESTYYIKHPFNGTDWEWREMTASADKQTWTLSATYGGTGCNWNTQASDAGAQWIAEPTLVGNPQTGDEVVFSLDIASGTITISKDTGAAIENTEAVAAPQKVVRNGVVYILRGDVLYTTMGQIAQ